MNRAEARELLRFHSGSHPDLEDPRGNSGFLGSLRPYQGLRIENFHEVMTCIRVLAPELQQATVDRQTMNDLWGICHFGRAWGVWPEGMLRRNDLITIEDSTKLGSTASRT